MLAEEGEVVNVNRKINLTMGVCASPCTPAQRQCPLCPPIEELLDDYSVEYDFFYFDGKPDPAKLQSSRAPMNSSRSRTGPTPGVARPLRSQV